MRKLLIIISLMCCTFCAFAQEEVQQEDPKVTEMRQQIGIDYSMPVFDVKRIESNVIGVRLAKMLEFLQKNYTQGTYNRQLASIRYEFTEDPQIRFEGIDRFNVLQIKKEGEIITVHVCTMTKTMLREKLKNEFDLVFDKGISNSDKVNNLFADINRYIKIDELENEELSCSFYGWWSRW